MPITSKRYNEVVTFTRDIQVTGKLGQAHAQFPLIIDHYNPLVKGLGSSFTYHACVVNVNSNYESLVEVSERQIFKQLFTIILLGSQTFCQKSELILFCSRCLGAGV